YLPCGSPLVSTTSYNRVLTLSTQDPGRLHLAAPVIGWQNLDRCSRALWNRTRCDLENDEMLAQTLNRGEIEVWRDVYRRAKRDARLRQRMTRIVLTVPTPLPRFWLAALASLGESVDIGAPVPDYTPQSVCHARRSPSLRGPPPERNQHPEPP